MKTLLIASLIFFTQAQPIPKGEYEIPDGKGFIELYEKEGKLYGKTVRAENPEMNGFDVLRDFEFKKDKWVGKIYSAEKKKLFKASLVEKDDELKITVSAGLMKKRLTWKKVATIPEEES